MEVILTNVKTGEIKAYKSMRECALKNNHHSSTVKKFATENKIHKGYRYSFKIEDLCKEIIEISKPKKNENHHTKNKKPVYNHTTGEVYESITACGLALSLHSSYAGRLAKANGVYKGNRLSMQPNEIVKDADVQLNLDTIAKDLGVSRQKLIELISNKFINDKDFKVKTRTITLVEDCEMNLIAFGKIYMELER